jgi:hypothetical protein
MKTNTTQFKFRMLRINGRLAINYLAALVLAGSIYGCASTEIDPMEASFGNSVQRMVEAQTHQPVPPPDQVPYQSPEGLDGKLGEQVYKKYRTSTGEQETVKSGSLDIDVN